MRDDLPMIVTLNAQSAPLSASSDGQVFAVNQTQNRFRAFARRLSFQPDAKYIRARCGPMKEHMLDPGGNAKIDDVLAKEWKERVGTPRRGRMAIGYDITFSRVGGAEPPTRRAFDVLSPSNVRHGRGFVVEPTGWLLPNADLPLICTVGVAKSDDPASVDTHIYCANVATERYELTSHGSSITTYDGTTDQLMAPANRSCEAGVNGGEIVKIGEVARWEWYHAVVIDVIFKRGGRAVVWQDYDLAQVSPVKHILPQVGIAKVVLPRSWALPQ